MAPSNVLNRSGGTIHVAVDITSTRVGGAESGAYYEIPNNDHEAWERSEPGATAFVIRGNPANLNGVHPEVHFIAFAQTLIIDPLGE